MDQMRFRSRQHRFTVSADRRADRQMLSEALAPFAESDDPRSPTTEPPVVTTYELRTTGLDEYSLIVDGRRVRLSSEPAELLDLLLWYVGEFTVRLEDHAFVLHAGAVVGPNGCALLLPGPSGSGKSTTTFGLVRSGFDYLSDEFAVIDPVDSTVSSYPRPMALKAGARLLWPEVDDLAGHASADPRWTVHLPASRLGARTPEGPVVVGNVVFPRYAEGATTALEPMSPGETCMELVRSTFDHDGREGAALCAMAAISRRARGYRMVVGDLDDAIRILTQLTLPIPTT